jgi:hypothetical protein
MYITDSHHDLAHNLGNETARVRGVPHADGHDSMPANR